MPEFWNQKQFRFAEPNVIEKHASVTTTVELQNYISQSWPKSHSLAMHSLNRNFHF